MARPSRPEPAMHGPERQSPGISGQAKGDADGVPMYDRTSTFKSRSAPGPDPLLRLANGNGWTAQMHHPASLRHDSGTD